MQELTNVQVNEISGGALYALNDTQLSNIWVSYGQFNWAPSYSFSYNDYSSPYTSYSSSSWTW